MKYTINNARFTVIENGVIRMEYSENGSFVDGETFFAVRDYETQGKCGGIKTKILSDGAFYLETPLIKLTYKENGKPFNRTNLTAYLNTDGKWVYWYPSKKNKCNLYGALSTLDGCSGERELPESIIARDGWHLFEDKNTTVIENGEIKPIDKGHICDYYLFVYGHDYKSALRSLAHVSGKTPLPRKAVFGSWYSRWHDYTAEEFLDIVDGYDKNDFPIDILVVDMGWHYNDWQVPEGSPYRTKYGFGHAGGNMGWTGYTWNTNLIPDPEGFIKEVKKRGLSITLNDHPADGIRENEDCYGEFADLMGLDKANKENIPFLCGDKKYMDAFFKCAHEPKEKIGMDFWWLDWQQDGVIPEIPGVKGQKVLPWLNYLYFKNSESKGLRGQNYSRWSGVGDQKHPIFFSGDTAALWEALAFEVKMTVTSGNDLCFWWGHDIGGFFAVKEEPENEMYTRWVQFGITGAALKLHCCGENLDRRPWLWEKRYCDIMRDMFHLRSRLMPTIYSLAYRSSSESVPFIEGLYYEYPEEENAYKYPYEYLLGGKILCAPITEKGEGKNHTVTKEVWLPEGEWYNLFTGEKKSGTVKETCDIETFPMYIKAGMPLVMQPYTNRMTAAVLDSMTVRIYLPSDGTKESFSLYEDDGISKGYENGEYLITDIVCERLGNEIKIRLSPRGKGFEGMVKNRSITFELCSFGKVTAPKVKTAADGILTFTDSYGTEESKEYTIIISE